MAHNMTRNRSAFTLVEMLVASALVIFMMYVIASAFESGLNSFRVLKTQGDMQEKLRGTASTIRMDLTAMHFGDGKTLSGQLLNDQSWQPPSKGYFRISQSSPPLQSQLMGTAEGMDPDGANMPYYRMSAAALQNTYLQFTVNLTDGHPAIRDARGRRDQFLMTPFAGLNAYSWPDYNRGDPGNATLFTSYWAEVTLFARPNGRSADGAGKVPLYDLFRRQKLLVEPAPPANYPPMYSANSGNIDTSYWSPSGGSYLPFNGAADVTEPLRRWGMNPNAPFGQPAAGVVAPYTAIPPPFSTVLDEVGIADPRSGGDLILTDVVNFDIKVLWEPIVVGAANATRFNTNVAGNFTSPSPTNNPDYPFDYLPAGANPGINAGGAASPRIFDTWSANNDFASGTTYNYGPPTITMTNAQQNVQQEFGAWNRGHFTPLPGVQYQQQDPNYTIPLRVRVRALQIKLRIWDQKSQQTRQITIIQDM